MAHSAIKFDPITVGEAVSLSGLNRNLIVLRAKQKKFRARRPSRSYQIDRVTFLDWLESTENRV